MGIAGIEQEQTIQIEQRQKLVAVMKLANFMNLPEDEFAKFIREIENDPLFIRLTYPEDKTKKVITYRRLPHTDLATNFYELKENIAPDKTEFDAVSFLENKEEIISTIKKIGEERFKKYFLYNEDKISGKLIADECSLSLSEVKRINDFVNELSIRTEFFYPSTITPQIHYSKIASIEKDGSGGFFIKYYSPNLARGEYSINYEKIAELKKDGTFPKSEIKALGKLLKKLELINLRKATIYQIIYHILQIQTNYLRSADWRKIKFFSQRELALKINVHPSVINRMIGFKSLGTPWGEEKPIKFFFGNRKSEVQGLIREIIEEEPRPNLVRGYSDEQIRNKLKNEHEIIIARRTVREYRNELKIPSTRERWIHPS